MKPLTPRQSEVIAFIRKHLAELGYPPTIRELADGLGIKSTNGVSEHLRSLEKKGYVARDAFHARGIRLLAVRP